MLVAVSTGGAGASPLLQEEIAPTVVVTAPLPATGSLPGLFGEDSGDEWRLILSNDIASRTPIPRDPGNEALRALTGTMREDTTLRQIMRTTQALRTFEPLTAQQQEEAGRGALGLEAIEAAGGRPVPADAAGGVARNEARARGTQGTGQAGPSRQAEQDAPAIAEPQDASDAVTLRQAMRQLVTTRRGRGGGRGDDIGDAAAELADDADDDSFGLGERLLESRILGEVLEASVQRNGGVADGTFSILGEGQFMLDVEGESHQLSIVDSSTGLSAKVALRDPDRAGPREAPRKFDLFGAILEFLGSPTGTLSSITGGVLLLIWGMVKVATSLKR